MGRINSFLCLPARGCRVCFSSVVHPLCGRSSQQRFGLIFQIIFFKFIAQHSFGHAQHIGGRHAYQFGYLKLTNALHGSSLPDGSYGGNPAGLLIESKDGKHLYFAGDTGLFGDMRLIGEEGIDFAALPIGDNYTMGPDDALRAVKLLNPQVVMPMHYDTFELINQDAKAWAERVEKETSAKCILLKAGESYTL